MPIFIETCIGFYKRLYQSSVDMDSLVLLGYSLNKWRSSSHISRNPIKYIPLIAALIS